MTDHEKKPITICGIEFAPILIPLRRRLQTLTVAFFFVFLLLAMFVVIPVFIYLALFTKYWYIPALYFAWIYYDRKTPYEGGRNCPAFRNSKVWDYFRDYFPVRLVKTADLSPDKNYIFCIYPHGVASVAALLNFQSNANKFDELYPGIEPHLVTLNANFRIPFTKDFYLLLGSIAATEGSMLYCLNSKPGASCTLIPGGAQEALISLPGKNRILLKSRKGFVRVGLKAGASLVPVYSFGESEVFDQITAECLLWLQDKLRQIWGIAPCLIKGRGFFQYSFGILPRRNLVTTVVGKEIPLPKVENPSQELVNEYHQKFVDELTNLFNTYKGKYHFLGENTELEIF